MVTSEQILQAYANGKIVSMLQDNGFSRPQAMAFYLAFSELRNIELSYDQVLQLSNFRHVDTKFHTIRPLHWSDPILMKFPNAWFEGDGVGIWNDDISFAQLSELEKEFKIITDVVARKVLYIIKEK